MPAGGQSCACMRAPACGHVCKAGEGLLGACMQASDISYHRWPMGTCAASFLPACTAHARPQPQPHACAYVATWLHPNGPAQTLVVNPAATLAQTLEGHTDEIFSCAFNYEGDFIITGGWVIGG